MWLVGWLVVKFVHFGILVVWIYCRTRATVERIRVENGKKTENKQCNYNRNILNIICNILLNNKEIFWNDFLQKFRKK